MSIKIENKIENRKEALLVKDSRGNYWLFECPHCDLQIQVGENETNCCIFRHGVIKESGDLIGPHQSQEVCESLFNQKKIYGCGKPFRLVLNTDNEKYKNYAEVCDWI